MKKFVFFHDRFEDSTTSLALSKENIEHIVLCHNNKDKFNCIGSKGDLIETNEPVGVQNNFNYALSLLDENDWGIFISDDYKKSQRLINGKFVDCNFKYVLEELEKAIYRINDYGIQMVGLSATGNAFYSKKNFSKYGLVDSRCFAIKKSDFVWDKEISTCPDYYATAYFLNKIGGNLIVNYCYADFQRYGKGGLGTIEERKEKKIKDCKRLIELFPNNIEYKEKVNQPKYSHIRVKRG